MFSFVYLIFVDTSKSSSAEEGEISDERSSPKELKAKGKVHQKTERIKEPDTDNCSSSIKQAESAKQALISERMFLNARKLIKIVPYLTHATDCQAHRVFSVFLSVFEVDLFQGFNKT